MLCTPRSTYATAPEGPGEEETPASIVFVIDVSSSMADEIDELKKSFREFIEALKPGQMVGIVAFGGSPDVKFEGTMDRQSQKEKLLEICEGLSCTDHYTNIPFGLYRGAEQLLEFYRKEPDGVHNLVVLSDGKDHPPPDTPIDTYDEARKLLSRFPKESMGKGWQITYVSLGPEPDVKLKDFLAELWPPPPSPPEGLSPPSLPEDGGVKGPDPLRPKSGPSIGAVRIRPGIELRSDEDGVLNLGEASASGETRADIRLHVIPLMGEIAGASILVKPVVVGATSGTRLTPEAIPPEIQVPDRPATKTITLSILGACNNEICGILQFEPADENISIINPPLLKFRFLKPPPTVAVRFRVRSTLPDEYYPRNWLNFMDLVPGMEAERTLILEPEELPKTEKLEIHARPEIVLPEGLTIGAEVDSEGLFIQKRALVKVKAKADPEAELKPDKQWKGELHLSSPLAGISFMENPIPLRVSTPVPPSIIDRFWEWMGQQVGEDDGKDGFNWLLIAGIIAALVALIGIFFGFSHLRLKIYESRFVPPEGWLVVLERPGGNAVQNVDLKALSKKLGKSTILIGRDPSCDIVLPHESVGKRHAEIRSRREGTPAPVYIRSLELNDIRINSYQKDEETKLQDRDIIDIGGFQFIYSNSPLKQVVVHYRDGDVKYGVPLTWNIEEEGFVLRPEGEGAEDLQAYIAFKDLKGVFFVKHFDKEIARKMKVASLFARKDHVFIEFEDGEKVEGYTMREYDANLPRFFVVPKPKPDGEENNICILVERVATKKVKLLAKAKAQTREKPSA